jgi:hypothetical protein
MDRGPPRRARADDAPRVSSEVRDAMIARIDRIGEKEFSREAVGNPEAVNPELLRVAHGFASERRDYAHAMQGLALLHEALCSKARPTVASLMPAKDRKSDDRQGTALKRRLVHRI